MFASSNAGVLLRLHSRLLRYHAPALSRIFRAVERGHVRRVSIEIRTRDPKLLLMRVNPLPQLLGGGVALRTVRAFDAHEIGRKPVAVPAAPAPAMVGAVARSLVAACDRLPIVIPKCACDARHMPRIVHRAKRAIELQLEAGIHASNHVILKRHASFFCRDRILPGEVTEHIFRISLDESFSNGPGFLLLFNGNPRLDLDSLHHLVGVNFWRALINRPEVIVDADFGGGGGAFAWRFNRAHGKQGILLQRIRCEQRSEASHGARTLAMATGISGDSGSAVSSLSGIESTGPTSASDETGLGDARSAGATSARTVAAVDASIRSGIPTTAVPTALGMGIIAVACGASAASRSAVKNIGTSGESRSSVAAAWKCSMPGESSPAGQPVTQPARSTVPPNAARAANRVGIITLASPARPRSSHTEA